MACPLCSISRRRSSGLILLLLLCVLSLQLPGAGTSRSSVPGSILGALVKFVVAVLLLLLTLMVALVLCGGPVLAKAIKSSIESCDKGYIGVDVTIEELTVSLRKGLVDIKGLVVSNYPGYSAEYLMRVDRAVADVNTWRLLASCLREVEVERLIFRNVDLIWEKSGLTHSNIKEVVHFLSGRLGKPEDSATSNARPQAPPEPEHARQRHEGGHRTVKLRVVQFDDVGVKMASHLLHGAGMRLAVSDMDYSDFSAVHGSAVCSKVVGVMLLSILKTVVANTAGKSLGDKMF